MNDNSVEQRICHTTGCDNFVFSSKKYCPSCAKKLSKWLKKATTKVYHYEQLNLCPSSVTARIGDYYEDNKTVPSDSEFLI